LCPVQDDNHEHTPGERHPRFHCLGRVIHQAQPFVSARGLANLSPGVYVRGVKSTFVLPQVDGRSRPHVV
jgi:hypothetical protein